MKLKFKTSLKMKKFFRKDSTLRLIALGLAVFLLIFVNDELNPIVSFEVTVPLKLKNENILLDKGLTIANKNIAKNISVVVKGRKQKISGVSAESLDAFISLDKIEKTGKSENIPIEVTIDNNKADDGISIDNYSPKNVETDVERTGKNIFKVEVITKGELKPGYKLIAATSNPESISLQGGATFFSSVASVKVIVDIGGLDHDVTTVKDCRIYDKNGKEIVMTENNFLTNIGIEVAKEVPVIPVISGKPDSSYSEVLRQTTPSKTYIKGDSAILDGIDDIRTETFVIDGIRDNVTRKVNLSIPNGVKLLGTSKEVEVTVNVEKNMERTFIYENKDMEILNGKTDIEYALEDKTIEMDIIGSKSDVEKFIPTSIKPKIDVGECKLGDNNVLVKIQLPEGLKTKKDYFVTVNVSKTR